MIGPFIEGIAQALLPCSWVVFLPAVAVGIGTRRLRVPAALAVAVVSASWIAVAGWLAPPVWLAGLALLAGSVLWWFRGSGVGQASAIGAGAAWAWQPCVGAELGQVLNTAQLDPLAALPGLAAFMLGILVLGLGLGATVGFVLRRRTDRRLDRPSAVMIGLLGLSMIVGVYSSIASILARWSTALWT